MLGIIAISFDVLTDSCEFISNVLILSIVVSKNSNLNGNSSAKEYTSIMPPLIENCPGSMTKSTFLKFRFNIICSNISISIWSEIFNVIEFFFNSFLLTTFSDNASG